MADLPEGIDWSAGIYQLEVTDPVIGGAPNVVTGNGKSNIPHLLLANRTQWLKRNMMAFNSTRSITGATVLDGTDIGRLQVIVANATITLPDATAVGAGATLHFVSTAATASTITAAGTDTIGGAASTNVASVPIGLRGTLTLVSNGAGTWVATAGTVHQAGSFAFGASLTGNGYQRLPTGLILQWGSATQTAGLIVPVTFPIAFPTACRAVLGTHVGAGGASVIEVGGTRTLTGVTLKIFNDGGTQSAGFACSFLAIGH